jgi:hypothetical protein
MITCTTVTINLVKRADPLNTVEPFFQPVSTFLQIATFCF